MHLFESPWLLEPIRPAAVPSYRRPTFGARYGRAVASRPTDGNAAASRHDTAPVAGDSQAARAILREMARCDHATQAQRMRGERLRG